MDDLTTPEGVLKFCAEQRAAMAAAFERDGRFETETGFSFMAWAFMTHEMDGSETGKKLEQIEPYPCRLPKTFQLFPRQAHSEIFGRALRSFAKLGRATGVLLMSETWTLTLPEDKSREDFPADLEEAPGRRECLFMQLEHIDLGRRLWTAEIHREPTRLDAWKDKPYDAVHGRLVNLAEWQTP